MTDCLVIGGGVVGLSAAYELATRGVATRVLERGRPGREASWAGAGILPATRRSTAIHALDQLRAISHDLYPAWSARLLEETGIDNGYRACGGIYLARTAGEAASLSALAGWCDELQIAIERLAPDALRSLEPALGELAASGRLKAAYRTPGEAQLRNPDHLAALRAACLQKGVEILTDREAKGFDVAGRRVTTVLTDAGPLRSGAYCLTCGAWTGDMLRQLGVSTGILPVRGQMAMFRCAARPFRHVLNEGPRYIVPRDDGRVLAGSTEEEVGFNKQTTEVGIAELVTMARDIIPARDAPVEKTWAGLRPGSFDGFPYIGVAPGLDNLFVAAGHYRSGLHMAPATAVVLRELVTGQTPSVNLRDFAVGRG